MTLEEMKRLDKPYLNAADVADLMRSDPQAIRDTARLRPERLQFPTICVGRSGRRVKIPREAFIAWWTGAQMGVGAHE